MGTVSLHGLRVRRLQRALHERGVRDVKLVFSPSADSSPDELTASACTVVEAYVAGKVSKLATAGL